jgi:hypothetical protein
MKHSLIIAIAGVVLVGMTNTVLGAVKDYDVMLTTQGPSGTLKAHLGFGQSCAVNWHDGCMNFDVNTVGIITFYLPGPPDRLTCVNPVDPGKVAKKVITKIELTDKPLDGGATAPKGDFKGGLADTWLKKYAFPQVDQATGVLYDVDVNDGLARITLVNLNSHPFQSSVTKPFWYRVTVTDCEPPHNTWETDPRGDNKGLN